MEENRSPLYQGLLQVAVGLYHARNNNTNGATKLLTQALSKLELYPNHKLGIDMDRLLQECRQYVIELQQHVEMGPAYPFYDLDIHIIDELLAADVQAYKVVTPD